MENLKISRAAMENLSQLQMIGRQTFSETFAAVNTEEDMASYLAESFADDKLSADLKSPFSQFYFAWLEGEVVGYLKLNTGAAQTDIKDQDALEIERIYVLKEFHGKNVGQLLYHKAIEIAQEMGAQYVWLGVWENNPRAIRFYEKNGFVEFDQHIFMLGTDKQTDIMMKKILK